MYKQRSALALALILMSTGTLNAQDLSAEVADLRQMLTEMKNDYESRIEELETTRDQAGSRRTIGEQRKQGRR